jgi:hypothetical protein
MENRLDLAAYRLVADTERLRRGFQRSSCDEVNNKACLCRGQIEPVPKKCHRHLAAHKGSPLRCPASKMPKPTAHDARHNARKVLDISSSFQALRRVGAFDPRHLYRRRISSPVAARAPPAAMLLPRCRARLRIFLVRCALPYDPPVWGHSCNGGMIPRFHRAVCD